MLARHVFGAQGTYPHLNSTHADDPRSSRYNNSWIISSSDEDEDEQNEAVDLSNPRTEEDEWDAQYDPIMEPKHVNAGRYTSWLDTLDTQPMFDRKNADGYSGEDSNPESCDDSDEVVLASEAQRRRRENERVRATPVYGRAQALQDEEKKRQKRKRIKEQEQWKAYALERAKIAERKAKRRRDELETQNLRKGIKRWLDTYKMQQFMRKHFKRNPKPKGAP